MTEEPTEIGKFGFGLRLLRHSDGRIEYRTKSANQKIPIEIVIMQIRAFLKNLENGYFDKFKK